MRGAEGQSVDLTRQTPHARLRPCLDARAKGGMEYIDGDLVTCDAVFDLAEGGGEQGAVEGRVVGRAEW